IKEHWRNDQNESKALGDFSRSQSTYEDPERRRAESEEKVAHETRISCLRQCLGQLSAENLSLITKYYGEGDVLNKEQRKQVAIQLRISVNALRVRAFRIRSDVERCVALCVQAATL